MNEVVNKDELVGATGTSISTVNIPFTVGVIYDRGYLVSNRQGIIDEVYPFLCDIEGVEIGNKVIVENDMEGFVVVTVTEMAQYNPSAKDYIVGKLDITQHNIRKERAEKKRVLKTMLDAAVAKLDQEAKLKAYADQDETFAEMYKEYKSL